MLFSFNVRIWIILKVKVNYKNHGQYVHWLRERKIQTDNALPYGM